MKYSNEVMIDLPLNKVIELLLLSMPSVKLTLFAATTEIFLFFSFFKALFFNSLVSAANPIVNTS